jgi:hypothetical protein
VRLEIASALRRDIPVVPVLVRSAKMPRAEQLTQDLRELAYRNAVELTHARWKSDLQVLIRALKPYLPHESDVPSTTATALDKAVLDRVSRELAAFIGPIAEVVVKRAAKRCTSMADLCGMVAQEIESNADRTKFLASCRR